MLYLPENLKKYRILKNLTQEDITEYLGITTQSVSKWKRESLIPVEILKIFESVYSPTFYHDKITYI